MVKTDNESLRVKTGAMSQAAAPGAAAPMDPAASRSRLLVVSAIGVAQILAWGASYYLLAVLAGPIARDTGWPPGWIMGSLSLGLLVSGLVSPRVGHLIDQRGGRPVLAGSALLLAAGVLLLGLAPNLPVFVLARIVLGVGMGAGLYDPAFSALGRLYGESAREAITQVTLFGGFSMTICWPLTAFLGAHFGWRGACLAYAAILVAIVLPLYWLGLPREERQMSPPAAAAAPPPGHLRPEHRIAFTLLAAGFTLSYGIVTLIAVHLLTLLGAQGFAQAAAVGFGALVGPFQVGGRLLEMTFGRKAHPIWSLLASFVLIAIGLGMLVVAPGTAAVFIAFYGMGSGIRSIARGTVPLAMFGREGYAILMGRLSLPTLLATAAAPTIGTWLLDWFGPTGTLAALCWAAVLNVALVLPLLPMALRRPGVSVPPAQPCPPTAASAPGRDS